MDKHCECCFSPNNLTEFTEDYSNLIISCFSIEIEVSTNSSSDVSKNLICDLCVGKLNESFAFRDQILNSQNKLKNFRLPKMTNDDIKNESTVKTEPVCKEEFLSDCEIDDFDSSLGVNKMCIIENLNVQIKNESNELPIRESEFSNFNTLNDSNNPLIERNETLSERNVCLQSNLKIIPIQKLKKTLTTLENENMPKSDSKHEYPYNMNKTALTCEVCNETFITHSLLLSHIGVHFSSIHICDVCEKIFDNRKGILQHMKRHNTAMCLCWICNKLIRSSYMKVHIKIHDKYLRFKCSQCSERFTTGICRLKHMNKMHNVDIYKFHCNACPKKFYSRGRLNQHIKICSSIKNNLICDFCGKKFYNEVYLEVHKVREHAGECPICHKKYKIVAFLANHIATFHNGKYFKCKQCNSEFTRESYLLNHVQNKHPQLCPSS